MNVTLTGSLGRIGRPLAGRLLADGHRVTVVSSDPARAKAIRALGATPAIGRLEDVAFLASSFAEADLAYVMAPPADYFDRSLDLLAYFQTLGHGFAEAVRTTGVARVVNLSSIGAHRRDGTGILRGTYDVEQCLDALPDDVAVTHVRPLEIYYNLYPQVGLIRDHGIMGGTLAPDGRNAWVAPRDIADAVTAEVNATPTARRSVRYVTSDECTYAELASAVGAAVGQPDLPWVQIGDDEFYDSLAGAGMQPAIAAGMVEMYAAIRSGLLHEDYLAHKPTDFGQVKVDDFAREFAAVYRR